MNIVPTEEHKNYIYLKNEAERILPALERMVKSRFNDYFWPNETLPRIHLRVKKQSGFKEKLEKQGVSLADIQEAGSANTDFAGMRIVVADKHQVTRVLEILGSLGMWEIDSTEAFAVNTHEQRQYDKMGLSLSSKVGPYCGVHVDLHALNSSLSLVRWVEVQIRSTVQHSWMEKEHALYKAGALPHIVSALRISTAQQFEAAEINQSIIVEHVNAEVVPKNPELKFGPLYELYRWDQELGLPKDFKGRYVVSKTLDFVYWIDAHGVRHTLVENSVDESPIFRLITRAELLAQKHVLAEQLISLPDSFVATFPLGDDVDLKSRT